LTRIWFIGHQRRKPLSKYLLQRKIMSLLPQLPVRLCGYEDYWMTCHIHKMSQLLSSMTLLQQLFYPKTMFFIRKAITLTLSFTSYMS
jgi:hypothetical protein